LAEQERMALLAAGNRVQFADDGILVLQGDPGEGLYVLISGMVKVTVAAESGTQTMLAVRSRGDLIGEFAVLDGGDRTATARAVGAVSAVRISRLRFAEFGQRFPAAQATITKSLVAKMRAATERHAAERTWGARERVAQVLYELAADYGEPAGDGAVVIPLSMTQSELGELAGVAVSTTERVLGELRKEGVIATRYRKIAVHDMDVLGAARFSSHDREESITGGRALRGGRLQSWSRRNMSLRRDTGAAGRRHLAGGRSSLCYRAVSAEGNGSGDRVRGPRPPALDRDGCSRVPRGLP
jgi:CRP/FNR family transcriptional regulator, cyclic AMP receptor protein